VSEVFHEFVKSWCPQTRLQVELTLECRGRQLGSLVQGRPVDCNGTCQVRTPLCLLKADLITTRKEVS
jgi:hypothetical protein